MQHKDLLPHVGSYKSDSNTEIKSRQWEHARETLGLPIKAHIVARVGVSTVLDSTKSLTCVAFLHVL